MSTTTQVDLKRSPGNGRLGAGDEHESNKQGSGAGNEFVCGQPADSRIDDVIALIGAVAFVEITVSRNLKLLIIASLFLLSQFWSVGNAMVLLAEMSDNEDIDDISLEDVVTVDPFVSCNVPALFEGGKHPGFSGSALELPQLAPVSALLSWLLTAASLAPASVLVGGEVVDTAFQQADQPLWLRNRSLLI